MAWLVTSVGTAGAARPCRPTSGASGPRGLATVGLVVFVVMWLPPLVQQFTNHPGNLTLIARFFDANHPGQPLTASPVGGRRRRGGARRRAARDHGLPPRAAPRPTPPWPWPCWPSTVGLAVVTTVVAARRRARFAFGVGVLTLLGLVTSVVAVTHVVGFIFGYLVLWIVVLPVAALISIGMVPRRPAGVHAGPRPTGTGLRVALCVVALAVGVVACVRVAAIPPLARAGDPEVGRLAALVVPHLAPGQRVAVGDAGAGTTDTLLLDVERFVGLVDALDRAGYHPTVNKDWKAPVRPWLPGRRHRAPPDHAHDVDPVFGGPPRLRGARRRHGGHRDRPVGHTGAADRLSPAQLGPAVVDRVEGATWAARFVVPSWTARVSNHGETSVAPAAVTWIPSEYRT